jgi:uncharacterized membrane protein YcaP (DUF421 family)
VESIDWSAVFIPALPMAEVVLRGTLIYLALFALLRVLPRREVGSIGTSDLLVLVLIADAVQNAMGAEYRSVTEGLVLVLTILFWSYVIDWVDYRFPGLHLVSAPPRQLIRNGRILRANLRKERFTEAELMTKLRENGVQSADQVESAYLEGNGKVSVVPKGGG